MPCFSYFRNGFLFGFLNAVVLRVIEHGSKHKVVPLLCVGAREDSDRNQDWSNKVF